MDCTGGGGGGGTGGFHVEDVVHGSVSGDEYFCETECDGGAGGTGGFHVEDVVHGSVSGDGYFCEIECDCDGHTAYDAELHPGAG